MDKRKYVILFAMIMISMNFVYAESMAQRQDGKLDEQYFITQPCASCSYVNISVFTKDGIILDNVPMVDNGTSWIYNFTPTTTLRHDVNGVGDINSIDDSFAFWFDITLSGNQTAAASIAANFLLFLFLFGLIVILLYLHAKIDFDKWYNKIISRYEDKNPVKTFVSGLGYTFMKDGFYTYYLLGWPLLMIILDVAYTFNISSIYNLMVNLVDVYFVGMIIVGLIFVGNAYQFLKDTWDKFDNMKWGLAQ